VSKIVAVCTSEEKGTRKKAVNEGLFREDYGLVGDAHADCCTHRQVSLLARESIDKMLALGVKVGPGDFAENITTEGIDLVSLSIGTRISIGEDMLLEVTQIGKECHTPCAIYRQAGVCVMPTEGIFTRVICGGVAKVGDQLTVYLG
jgi:MOSC domain-containing protein YiiM